MSLESWKREYFDEIELQFISEIEDPLEQEIAALEHSLSKWRGLLPSNLKKHGMKPYYVGFSARIIEKDMPEHADHNNFNSFNPNCENCSLCKVFYDGAANETCSKCPLYSINDDCDNHRIESSWVKWVNSVEAGNTSSAHSMVKALTRCLNDARNKNTAEDAILRFYVGKILRVQATGKRIVVKTVRIANETLEIEDTSCQIYTADQLLIPWEK